MRIAKRSSAGTVDRRVHGVRAGLAAAVALVGLYAAPCTAEITVTDHPFGLVQVDDQVTVSWEENLDCSMRYGRAPGTHTYETTAHGWGSLEFTPESEGMNQGVYYCVIRDVDETDSSDEFVLIVDSPVFPRPATPPNGSTVTQTTTTLSWDPVDGVPYYHVVVSDHDIDVDYEDGEIMVTGANVVWQAITGATSIQYGSADPSGYFTSTNGSSPPLMSGLNYHWLVFNNFGGNPLLTSSAGAGLAAFGVDVPVDLEAPVLVSPPDSVVLTGEDVSFVWEPVEGAAGYHVHLYKEREWGRAEASFPVWDTPSPASQAEANIGSFLASGHYLWRVVAFDASGSGIASDMRAFDYATVTGTARIKTRREDGGTLPNALVDIELAEGGVSILPAVTDDAGEASQLLIPGEYLFTATKPDYRDTTVSATISADEQTVVVLTMRKAAAMMRGQVVSEDGSPVFDASVVAVSGGLTSETSTDPAGRFSMHAEAGIWTISAEKPGYAPSETVVAELHADDYIDVGTLVLAGTPGTISGNVVNDGGTAVSGATVTATAGLGETAAATDASGHFTLDAAPGEWTVSAEKSGFSASDPRAVLVDPGGDTQMSPPLVLSPVNCAVMGRVVDGRSSVAGAVITAAPPAGAPVTSMSNDRGEFVLLLPPGRFDLSAEKDGYTRSEAHQVDVTSGESYLGVLLALKPARCTLSGTVLEGAGPIAWATVTDGISETTSLSDGSFSLRVCPGLHAISAARSGFVFGDPLPVAVFPEGDVSGLTLIMTGNGCGIAGRVMCDDDPVPFAWVRATSTSDMVETGADEFGRFALSVDAGEWQIASRKDGFAPASSERVVVAAGQSVDGVLPLLDRVDCFVDGNVIDSSGPVGRVLVVATCVGEPGSTFRTSANTAGRYSLRLPPGRAFSIEYSAPAHEPRTVEVDPLPEGETRTADVSLAVRDACVRGKVTSIEGVALSGVIVYAEGHVDAGSASDQRGNYDLWLPAGSYDLHFERSGYETALVTDVEAVSGENSELDVQLHDLLARVTGSIADSLLGEPVEGALVTALSDGGASDVTDSGGRYELTGVVSGSVDVRVSKRGFETRLVPLQLGDSEQRDLDVGLTRLTGSISGSVTQSPEGNPLPDARVVARLNGDTVSSAITGGDGTYEIAGLDPDERYDVCASRSGYYAASANPVTDVEAGAAGVDFTLAPCQGRITGTVSDGESGEPVQGASVTASDGLGHFGAASTDAQGAFALESLSEPANYDVSVAMSGYQRTVINDVAPGGEPLDVRLPRNFGVVAGTVSALGQDVVVTDVLVVATDVTYSGGSRIAEPDGLGAYEITDVRPGTYVLTAGAPGYICSPTQMTVVISEGQTITGADFLVERANVTRVELAGPTEIAAGASVSFAGSAFADDGRLVQAQLVWAVSPAFAGEMERDSGALAVEEGYFGEVTVSAMEPLSGQTGRTDADVYARLTPTGSVSVTDSLGMTLSAGPGAVSETKSIFVRHEELPEAMRYAEDYVVQRVAFHFTPCGMPFSAGNRPTLSVPCAGGHSGLVMWDHDYLTWERVESVLLAGALECELAELGLYGAVTESEPLGVTDVRAVPNPFSPIEGPVTIKYELTSDEARMPFVTVRVFNMNAHLVRELAADEPQGKGTVAIEWDGLTDDGDSARNGRYVVEVRARDTGGTESALGTVVLVK